MDNKKFIINFFKKYNIHLNLNIKKIFLKKNINYQCLVKRINYF